MKLNQAAVEFFREVLHFKMWKRTSKINCTTCLDYFFSFMTSIIYSNRIPPTIYSTDHYDVISIKKYIFLKVQKSSTNSHHYIHLNFLINSIDIYSYINYLTHINQPNVEKIHQYTPLHTQFLCFSLHTHYNKLLPTFLGLNLSYFTCRVIQAPQRWMYLIITFIQWK